MSDQEQPPEQSDALPRYAQTVRFRRVQAAKYVYTQIQQVLYDAEESDLSAYNLQLVRLGTDHRIAAAGG